MLAGDLARSDGEDSAIVEWTLTLGRIEADFKDAAHALAATHPRFRTDASILGRELDVKRIRVRGMVEELAADLQARPPRPVTRWARPSPRPSAARGHAVGRTAMVMLAILYGVVVVVIVAVITAGGAAAGARP
jgi:hypothetical protein